MNRTDATRTLRSAAEGDEPAANRLAPLVYAELRALAENYLRAERPGHTLQATALVNEAYIKLIDQHNARYRDRAHFFAVAAQAIRRILVDHARTRGRNKRGGGQAPFALDCEAIEAPKRAADLVHLDEALERLAQLNPRQAQIVELRFFGGLSIDDVAELLGTSARTVDGDWAMARAWLRRELEGSQADFQG